MKKLIPETIENKIPSNKFVYFFTWLLVAFNFFRSLEHIFNDDGGAQSIAGIPLDFYIPEASNNIISIFAQWGFSQLVLACILLLIVLKIRELIPLMLLIISLENIFRAGIGQYKSLIIDSAPPGALTPLIGLVTLIFFFISIRVNN